MGAEPHRKLRQKRKWEPQGAGGGPSPDPIKIKKIFSIYIDHINGKK